MELTDRQVEVLDFISGFIASSGYSPSIAEIAGHMKINPNAAQQHVERLEKKGRISKQPGISRSIRVVELA